MGDFKKYEVEFRAKIVKETSNPDFAIKNAAKALIQECGNPDPSDNMVARIIEKFLYSVTVKE